MDMNIFLGLVLSALAWALLLCAATAVAVWIAKEIFPGITRRHGGRPRSGPRHTVRRGSKPADRKDTGHFPKAA